MKEDISSLFVVIDIAIAGTATKPCITGENGSGLPAILMQRLEHLLR